MGERGNRLNYLASYEFVLTLEVDHGETKKSLHGLLVKSYDRFTEFSNMSRNLENENPETKKSGKVKSGKRKNQEKNKSGKEKIWKRKIRKRNKTPRYIFFSFCVY